MSTGYNERVVIPVRVGVNMVMGLVDTGSEVSLVKSDYVDGCELLSDGVAMMRGVGGDAVCATAIKSMLVGYEEREVIMEMYVLHDVAWRGYDCILGVDWIHAVGACLKSINGEFKLCFDDVKEVCVLHMERGLENSREEITNQEKDIIESWKDRFACVSRNSLAVPADVPPVKLCVKDEAKFNGSKRIIRQGPVLQEKLKVMLSELEKDGVIERVYTSDVASPAFLVPKPGSPDAYRLVIDYRMVNEYLKDTEYPLPLIEDLFNSLSGCSLFTIIDLKDSYWQIPLDPESEWITVMGTPVGSFKWKRLPQGVRVGPNEQQRRSEEIICGIENVFAMMDDLIIATENQFDYHVGVVEKVLKRLSDKKFSIKLSKLKLARKCVRYLGMKVDGDGLSIDDERIVVIENFPVPNSRKSLRSMLGFFSYFRRFIPRYTELVEPLQKMVPKDVKFIWEEEQQCAMEKLKKALLDSGTLIFPDFEKTFEVTTDASLFGIGAVLCQDGVPVSYYSKRLSETQQRWSTTDRELYAIVASLERFRTYLIKPFRLITDHKNLVYLFKKKLSDRGKYARWIDFLAEFEFTIEHREGKRIPQADYLSRLYEFDVKSVEQFQVPLFSKSEIVKRQRNVDVELFRKWECKNYGGVWCKLVNGLMVPVIEVPDVSEVMKWHSVFAHMGSTKLLNHLRSIVWWDGMSNLITKVVRACEFCQKYRVRSGRQRKQGELQRTVYLGVFKELQIDILGPVVQSREGYRFIVSVVDMFSKFMILWGVKEITMEEVTKGLMQEVLFRYGVPWIIRSDNGSVFTSFIFERVCELFGIKHQLSTSYHPESQGLVERLNQFITKSLSAVYMSENSWSDVSLMEMSYVYNTTKTRATGFAPFFIMFGREAELIPTVEMRKSHDEIVQEKLKLIESIGREANRALCAAQENQQDYVIRKKITFDVGEKVLWCNMSVIGLHKLNKHLKWQEGAVKNKLGEVSYEVEDCASRKVYKCHVSRMRKFVTMNEEENETEESIIQESEVRDVEETVTDIEIEASNENANLSENKHESLEEDDERVNEESAGLVQEEAKLVPRRSMRLNKEAKKLIPFYIVEKY